MRDLRPNPKWTNQAFTNQWEQLRIAVGTSRLPVVSARTRHLIITKELGSGRYGTVVPSRSPNVVIKMTSDPDEAKFVACALTLNQWPEGMVRYYADVRLEAIHKARPVYVLWREEAFDVGEPAGGWFRRPDGYSRYAAALFLGRLDSFLEIASLIRDDTRRRSTSKSASKRKVPDWSIIDRAMELVPMLRGTIGFSMRDPEETRSIMRRYQGKTFEKVAFYLASAEELADRMRTEPLGRYVGDALLFYLRKGILLADVHSGNLGMIRRAGHKDPIVVITDPGMAVFLDRRWTNVDPQRLDARSDQNWAWHKVG